MKIYISLEFLRKLKVKILADGRKFKMFNHIQGEYFKLENVSNVIIILCKLVFDGLNLKKRSSSNGVE